jgi:hypothetical protein
MTKPIEPIGAALDLVVGGRYKLTPAAEKRRLDSLHISRWLGDPPGPKSYPQIRSVIRPGERAPSTFIPDPLPHRPGRGGPVGY